MFVQDLDGTLMEVGESPESRYRYVVWFDYTRRAINQIQEGTLLAVPNFATDGNTRRYSVLEVATVLPTHYALEGQAGGYPGFVVEAARSAAQDWESQEHTATEDTTKIRVMAIPTNLELEEPLEGDVTIGVEQNIGMVGSRVRVFDTEYTNLVANNGIDAEHEEDLTVIGTMTRDDDVDILLRIDEMYRTHFALFGFTGVGKSNLLSTIVSKVFEDAQQKLKLVFFDLMSEYTVLLMDQLLSEQVNGRLLSIGRNTLPEGVFSHINGLPGAPDENDAARQFVRFTLWPKALSKYKAHLAYGLRDLISGERLKVFKEAHSLTLFDFFFTDRTLWGKDRRGANIQQRLAIVKTALKAALDGKGGSYKEVTFTPDLARKLHKSISSQLEADGKFSDDFEPILDALAGLAQATEQDLKAGVTMDELVQDLNDPRHHSLWVIQAHDPAALRGFSKQLGETLYELRRRNGRFDPLVSFVFDEADEFIRRDGKGSFADSAEIAQTLARRGRKFGLGIGIATQRIRYLDTNIMSQPHTYFISKLPRQSDRQAVAEAFGVGEELLHQTFKFKKGQWLLISHDATGLEAIPVPIQAPNANDRIAQWLEERYASLFDT